MPLNEAATQWLADHETSAARLAAMISLAAFADPWLVRECRLWLGLAVAAELDVWYSPLVASSTAGGIAFTAPAQAELRQRLQADAQLLDAAWRITKVRHPSLSPVLREEEELTHSALSGGATAGLDAQAENMLNRVLVSIVRRGQTQFAAWAARALPRLPESVRGGKSARLLATAAQANGYTTPPELPNAGPPPRWMISPSKELVSVGAVLYPSRLELRFPAAQGGNELRVPKNRRVWVSWREGRERVTREVVIPLNRSVPIEAESREFVVEAPGAPSYWIADKASLGNARNVYLTVQSPAQEELARYVQEQLQMRGHIVSRYPLEFHDTANIKSGDDWTARIGAWLEERPDVDYLIYAGTRYPEGPLASACINRIDLRAPGSPLWLRKPGLDDAVVNFTDPAEWDRSIWRVLDLLRAPLRKPGALTGVPQLPAYYVRPRDEFDALRRLLLESDSGVVTAIGPHGSGRTLLAADVLRDCAVLRRFPGGILWFHSDNAWPSSSPEACCFVVSDPKPEHLPSIYQSGDWYRGQNSRILLLVRTVEGLNPSQPTVYVGPRTDADLLEIFFAGSGAAPTEIHLPLAAISAGSPSIAANAGRLWGMATRAGMPPGRFLANQTMWPWADLVRRALAELEILAPFSAWPPGAPLPSADHPVWNRYFPPELRPRVRDAFNQLQELGLLQNPQAFLEALAYTNELAAPAHDRIVRSYEEECGGDWAICADDGYYLAHFAYHLWRARPKELENLTLNLDWLLRAGREAPGWAADLSSTPQKPPAMPSIPQPTPLSLETQFFSSTGSSGVMARGRSRLRSGNPVRILVAGTGKSHGLDPIAGSTAAAIGRELARYGYGLTTGGWPGVDYLAAEAYSKQLSFWELGVEQGLLHVVAEKTRPDFDAGSVIAVPGHDTESKAIDSAAAMIAIGGEGGTLTICRLARDRGIPVFPVRRTGGDAETFYLEGLPSNVAAAAQVLDSPLDSAAAIYDFARKLMPFLPPNDIGAPAAV